MDNLFDLSNIFGTWKLSVSSPFGEETYNLILKSTDLLPDLNKNVNIVGLINHEKGSVNIDKIFFKNNIFTCSTKVDFPIKAEVTIEATVCEPNKMVGLIHIDEYLVTDFVGVK